MKRILIADDHPYLVTGVAMVLKGLGMDVCGQTNDSDQIIQLYKELKPDVLITDIMFTGKQSGLTVLKQLIEEDSKANVIILSQYDSQDLIQETYRNGVKAFLAKSTDIDELEEAIKHASEGEVYFPPGIAEKLAMLSTLKGDQSTNPEKLLDEKELTIFLLLAKGKTQAEVSDITSIPMRTVSARISSIKDKLKESRTARFAMLAIKHGLINIDDTLESKE